MLPPAASVSAEREPSTQPDGVVGVVSSAEPVEARSPPARTRTPAAIDANLLIYASVTSFPQHGKAKIWLDQQLNGDFPVGIPWPSCISFLRIITNPRIFSRPISPESAWNVVEYWLSCPSVWIPVPTDKHQWILQQLYSQTAPRANLVPDAHLAALAIEHGLLLCSADGDFARFPDLKWTNPLTES